MAKEEIAPTGAISSFVTIFSNVVCCSRCKHEYLWSKGLKGYNYQEYAVFIQFKVNVIWITAWGKMAPKYNIKKYQENDVRSQCPKISDVTLESLKILI